MSHGWWRSRLHQQSCSCPAATVMFLSSCDSHVLVQLRQSCSYPVSTVMFLSSCDSHVLVQLRQSCSYPVATVMFLSSCVSHVSVQLRQSYSCPVATVMFLSSCDSYLRGGGLCKGYLNFWTSSQNRDRRDVPSAHLSEWKGSDPAGRIFLKFYIGVFTEICRGSSVVKVARYVKTCPCVYTYLWWRVADRSCRVNGNTRRACFRWQGICRKYGRAREIVET